LFWLSFIGHLRNRPRRFSAKLQFRLEHRRAIRRRPDLDARLAKFKTIEMPFNLPGLSEREQKLVQKLVDAANRIEQIYWRQSDPEGLKLYVRLEKSNDPLDKKVLRFMKITAAATI